MDVQQLDRALPSHDRLSGYRLIYQRQQPIARSPSSRKRLPAGPVASVPDRSTQRCRLTGGAKGRSVPSDQYCDAPS
ncbi:hypothetical protein SS05631_c01010 [Sinorhizobium sp. CCBAU 05631]|nr:hypothetical protein SS05631_c01010 [Sinorhizobium sp. CCBAU 05631]